MLRVTRAHQDYIPADVVRGEPPRSLTGTRQGPVGDSDADAGTPVLQYDETILSSFDELARLAYLLTGDPERAQAMAEHALESAAQHARSYGPTAAME